MPRRRYLDLLAGPGCNIDRERNNSEFEGSPLRALRYSAPKKPEIAFTDAVFINYEFDEHQALSARVARSVAQRQSLIASERIQIRNSDANLILPEVMKAIPLGDYVFVFVDITGARHWPFSSVRELRRHGHRSVDLYLLFPLEMTLIRKLSFEEKMSERYARDLTAFFDGEEWRAIRAKRLTSADGPQLKREVTELYLSKLRTIWPHAEVQHTIYMASNRPLYRMIFASKHPIATQLAAWQKRHSQPDFFG